MEVVGTLGVAQGKGPGTSCSFPSMQKALGECGSREAAVRLLWGGGGDVLLRDSKSEIKVLAKLSSPLEGLGNNLLPSL